MASIAWLDESGGVAVHSSTQHPSETQEVVARVLGLPRHLVTVECLRMGGAFGGKEVQANPWAAIAALGAWKTRRPVRVRLPRVLDMALTGKRHPFLARSSAGFDAEGRLLALEATLYSDGGWSLDLSEPVMWRALFHLDNAYYLPAVDVSGFVCRTHKTSQTAFRGFGGPQGMLVIEDILDRIARRLSPAAGGGARTQLLSRRADHALRAARKRRGAHRHHLAPVAADQRLRRAARGHRGIQRRASAPQARPRHHAGEVRHLFHRRPSSIRPERWCCSIATAACR